VVAATVAGFVDTHSAAISVATLVGAGKMTATDAALPVLIVSSLDLNPRLQTGRGFSRFFVHRLTP
jgi:hypothetical protein